MVTERGRWAVAIGLFAVLMSATAADDLYREPYRPQIHFSPPQKWMNDPNGLVYLDGEYHLFYQYHPYGNRWGPMHWGHAVSRDLLRWENLPIGLFPDRLGAIWSGSAVVDRANTSGFGAEGKPPLVAVFTQHDHLLADLGRSKRYQTQGIAYSTDRGRNWHKFDGNPVLANPGIRDFRDPKVFWHQPSGRWIMSLAVRDHIRFYSSSDLKEWAEESRFGQEWGSHGGVWECPDLIELPVDGEDATRYVLLVSVSNGAPNGGSGTQYFVGDFDGKTFSLDPDEARRLEAVPEEFPEGEVFEDFGKGLVRWEGAREAFDIWNDDSGQEEANPVLNTGSSGDAAKGLLVSRPFTIRQPFINFRISGGNYPETLGVRLKVDGEIVRRSTGSFLPFRTVRSWPVHEFQGREAVIEVYDREARAWGQLTLDDLVFAGAPARPRTAGARWLDYGTDNYAGVTWAGVPEQDGRALFIGWMSNWRYAQEVPTERWRSAMTIARELRLRRTPRGLEVFSRPVAEVRTLRQRSYELERRTVRSPQELFRGGDGTAGALEVELTLDSRRAGRIDLTMGNADGQQVVFTIDPKDDRYTLDRTRSGADVPDEYRSGTEGDPAGFLSRLHAPRRHDGTAFSLRVLIDRSSVEVFVNEGETAVTAVVFPSALYDQITLSSDRPVTLAGGAVHQLGSIWPAEPK